MKARHISQTIMRPPSEVYAYARDLHHLHAWAHGLASQSEVHGDEVTTQGPLGKVRVRFAARNDLGVLDHDVMLPDGTTMHNPLRVVPNGKDSEVVFTVFHREGTDFDADCDAVAKDLATLARLLE